MFKLEQITKACKYGFWDEHVFLTQIRRPRLRLKIRGIDYESLDHAGRDYAIKRLEAGFCLLDGRTLPRRRRLPN